MTTGDTFEGTIESIAAGGNGITRFQGKVYFVEMACPGDRARFRITRESRDWSMAEIVELLNPSPFRTQPVCSYYGICGGCGLQHINYEQQLEQKKAILSDALTRLGGIPDLPEIRVVRSEPWGYRNRIQLHREGGKTGFKARNSDTLVEARDCPVSDEVLQKVLREGNIEGSPGADRFTLYGRDGMLLMEGPQGQGQVHIAGKDLEIDAGAFFQSNGSMLEGLIRELQDLMQHPMVDKSRPMADLYAGVGTFSCYLGEFFPSVDMLELNGPALELAKRNCARHCVRHEGSRDEEVPVNYIALTDDQWARELRRMGNIPGSPLHIEPRGGRKKGPYGFIIADPPRQGMMSSIRQWICDFGPPLMAYVSCNPATLARDSKSFHKAGFTISSLTYYDFYPQTAHIEALAVFTRSDPR